jgi:hypothetical protein
VRPWIRGRNGGKGISAICQLPLNRVQLSRRNPFVCNTLLKARKCLVTCALATRNAKAHSKREAKIKSHIGGPSIPQPGKRACVDYRTQSFPNRNGKSHTYLKLGHSENFWSDSCKLRCAQNEEPFVNLTRNSQRAQIQHVFSPSSPSAFLHHRA